MIDVRLKDLETGSLLTHQPIEGDELRAVRAWLRKREDYPNANSNYLFSRMETSQFSIVDTSATGEKARKEF